MVMLWEAQMINKEGTEEKEGMGTLHYLTKLALTHS